MDSTFLNYGRLPAGETYPLDELRDPPGYVSSTLPTVDQVTNGGIPAGGVWAIVGRRGAGVTNLALQIAVDCARSGSEALMVNDHVHTGSTRSRVRAMTQAGETHGVDEADLLKLPLRFASWIPDPEPDAVSGPRLNLFRTDPHLVVLDTLCDADSPPAPQPRDAAEHLARLHMWRAWARCHGRAVLATVRVPTLTHAVDLWSSDHAAHVAVAEVADVVVTIDPAPADLVGDGLLTVVASRQGPLVKIPVSRGVRTLRTNEASRA